MSSATRVRLAALEKKMPGLFAEMRADLEEYPFRRKCIVAKRITTYNAVGDVFFYYYDDHSELDGKIQVLVNCGLVVDDSRHDDNRFIIQEELADYLIGEAEAGEVAMNDRDPSKVALATTSGTNVPPKTSNPLMDADRNLFKKEDETWLLSFGGKQVRLRHRLGLVYLAEVLRLPGREIEALKLASSSVGENSVVDVGPGVEVADPESVRGAQDLLNKRRQDLAAFHPSDWPRRGQLEDEINQIAKYISETRGFHGRSRKIGGAAEQARKTVGRAIATTQAKIQKVHPELARHLKSSVRTGSTIVYLPETNIEWEF